MSIAASSQAPSVANPNGFEVKVKKQLGNEQDKFENGFGTQMKFTLGK